MTTTDPTASPYTYRTRSSADRLARVRNEQVADGEAPWIVTPTADGYLVHRSERTVVRDLHRAEDEWTPGQPTAAEAIVGRRAMYTTADGERLEGVIEAPLEGPAATGRYPIIRFADGRWGRCDGVVELVVGAG